MTIVKGSSPRRVKVVEERPYIRRILWLLLLLLSIAAAVTSHRFGYRQGADEREYDRERIAHLEQQLQRATREIAVLKQQLTNINLGATVDRHANEEVRQEVITLKAHIAKLEEENSFYRGLMAPTENKRGLSFGTVELAQAERPGAYRYKVVMQQLATNHQLLTGTLQYTVVGRSPSGEVSYPLHQLSHAVSEEKIRLRFKYFQTIEGELTLPTGFEPHRIELVARSRGKNPVKVEKRFGWLAEEGF